MRRLTRHRDFWPVTLAGVVLVATMGSYPAYAGWARQFHEQAPPPSDGPAWAANMTGDGHDHDHNDPATKNAVSRTAATDGASAETADPTTAGQAKANAAAVAAQRDEPIPQTRPAAAPAARATVPQDRYAMAGGCYALQSTASGKWVTRTSTGYVANAASAEAAEPVHFQATDLGTYLLWDSRKTFVAKGLLGVVPSPKPSTNADWTIQRQGGAFTVSLPAKGTALGVGAGGRLAAGSTTPFALRLTTGCPTWPEVDVDVEGAPFVGTSGYQQVLGYLDAHTHGMAFEFLGGQVHCGRPWHKYGVEYALKDCPDHYVANGAGALLENVLKDEPVSMHDPVGWPTFKDWPAPNSLTHEGTYYTWLERAWRGGQRVFVNLLVENNQLCRVYPLKRNSCDDMTSIRLQADDMRRLERYVDAQNGGPGKGWYRIVTDPFQARKVINAGKLAVVMGIETSVLFGCSSRLDRPTCTTSEIDRQLDEVHAMGVRQMELVNKFDNGLAGVAGDTGGAAPLINTANFLETGSFWDMRTCPDGSDPEVADRTQLTPPQVVPEQDALFGAIADLYIPIKLPLYAVGPHCNARGLTSLGDHTIVEMAKRKMIFDPDHMSVKARKASLDVAERLDYPGVVSSHSWSTPDAYPRIYRLGGVITPYAGDSDGFVEKWRKHLTWADPRYYFGFGFGADINGLGAQGDPRGTDVPDKVTYPFKGLGGVTIGQQHSGERVYDVNADGVAHYGLYPDWIEDLRRQAGQDIVDDMARGAEAYLQMWERAEGVTNDACREPEVAKPASVVRGVAKGSTVEQVLRRAGQPHSRLGTTFTYCTTGGQAKVVFDASGKVVRTS